MRLKATFVFIFDKSFGTGTYAIPKTSFPSKLYAVLCFIPPCVPARRFLPCEKLYPGNVAHKGNDFFPRYVRLFAVLLYGGDNELKEIRHNLRRSPVEVRTEAAFRRGRTPLPDHEHRGTLRASRG